MAIKTLGETIRELREKMDVSLRELAKKLDISAPFLSDVELGRRYPSEEVLAKLAKALRVPIEELKRHDHRGSISDLKRLIETNPGLGFAFRTAVDDVKQGENFDGAIGSKIKKGFGAGNMKRFRSQSGPFEEQLHFAPDEIDQMCFDALGQAKLLPDGPEAIRIERFIEKHFQCRVRYEDLGVGVLGCTIFNENGSVREVVVSSRLDDGTKTGERRVRSTLAHEGGHALMHSSLFMASLNQGRLDAGNSSHENLDFASRRILCRESDIQPVGQKRGYDRRWWEWQANRAIGGLLLPTILVRKAVAPLLDRSAVTGSPSLSSAKRPEAEQLVADTFDVNPVVARIRLAEIFAENRGQIEF